MPVCAFAQDDDGLDYGLDDGLDDEFALLEDAIRADEVESASKHRQSIFWSPSAITVFTREDIRMSGAVTLYDLLRRVPGFDVYEMKPSFPLVGARAMTEHSNNLVLVLIDGREALVELAGWPIWGAISVDQEEIERIEVIRGPGSALYGANAFAGLVSITTVGDGIEDGADIHLSGGEEGERRVFGRIRRGLSLGGGTLDLCASAGTLGRRSASDRDNPILYTDFHSNGYLRYRRGRDLSVSLQASLLHGGGFIYMLVGDYRTTNIRNHSEMAKAEIALADNLELKAQVYHSRYAGDFRYRTRIESRGIWMANVPDFYMDQNTIDGQLQLDHRAGDDLLLTGGANLRYNFNYSDNILPQQMSEVRGAGFLHAQWKPLAELQLSGGLRYDLNSETSAALSPRAVAVFGPWPRHTFRLGYGLAFRKPSQVEYRLHMNIEEAAFQEVIDKFAISLGNEGLVNEKVHSLEAGWRGHFLDGEIKFSLDLFYNLYRDMIYFESDLVWDALGRPNLSDSTFQYRNEESSITALGGEVEVAWKPAGSWLWWGNLGLRRVADEEGRRLYSEPRLRANLGCRLDRDTFFVDLAFHYVSAYRMPLSLPYEPFERPQEIQMGNEWLTLGRVGYRPRMFTDRALEMGLSARVPLGGSFREYPGLTLEHPAPGTYGSDFCGENLVRLVSFYLRSSF